MDPDYPGLSSLAGTSFSINGRAFGGLGWVLATDVSADDLWELVKPTESGVSDAAQQSSILQLSPIPASAGDELWISSDITETISLLIRDVQSKPMASINFRGSAVIITDDWPTGSYVAEWRSAKHSGATRFMIVSH